MVYRRQRLGHLRNRTQYTSCKKHTSRQCIPEEPDSAGSPCFQALDWDLVPGRDCRHIFQPSDRWDWRRGLRFVRLDGAYVERSPGPIELTAASVLVISHLHLTAPVCSPFELSAECATYELVAALGLLDNRMEVH